MKKILFLSTITAATLFATNGDHMIGLGAEERALGGTGVAMFTGSENALTNPSLLTKTKSQSEFSFGGTYFDATVKATTQAGSVDNPAQGVSRTSSESASVIPTISLSHRISDTTVFGLGMYGTAGMGTDWRDRDILAHQGKVDLYNMRSSLMLMQFAPSLSYGVDNWGIGATAIIQYGALGIDFDAGINPNNLGQPTATGHIGNGVSNDIGLGYQLGGFYNPMPALTLAAVYKSSIDMEYKDQISKAALAFGYGSHAGALAAKSDHLEQPAEIGIGISYDMGNVTYTGEIKEIKWGDAKGYKDFGWENQKVYALGVKYKASNYWLGLGYNYAKNPIKNNTNNTSVAGGTNTDGDTMNMFNYVMFPATTEKAYTLGGGKDISQNVTLSAAYTYSPEVSDTVSVATITGGGNLTTTHSQSALTLGVKYKF